MKLLLLFMPVLVFASQQPSKPIAVPKPRKCLVYRLPIEVLQPEPGLPRRKQRLYHSPVDIASTLHLPSPNLRQEASPSPSPEPEVSPKEFVINLNFAGKVVKLRMSFQTAEKKDK